MRSISVLFRSHTRQQVRCGPGQKRTHMELRISVRTLPSASCSNAETRFDGLKELIQATRAACSCLDMLETDNLKPDYSVRSASKVLAGMCSPDNRTASPGPSPVEPHCYCCRKR